MTTLAEPTTVEIVPEPKSGLLQRPPKAAPGLWGWLTTVDHKKIGLLYLGTAFAFFVIGGVHALIIHLQLGGHNGHVGDANTFEQNLNMHRPTLVLPVRIPPSARVRH